MFNPLDDNHFRKLRKAVGESNQSLEKAREKRLEALKFFVGKHYPSDSNNERQPINQIELAASILSHNLAASTPRAQVIPQRRDIRTVATAFSLALNKTLEWTNISDDFQVWIYEAMFSQFGILKVSLDADNYSEIDGEVVASGTPQISPILFDDWIHDMSARAPGEWAFCGHRYCVERQSVVDNPFYNQEAKQQLKVKQDYDRYRSEETDSLSLSFSKRFHEDYRDMVELWEVFLPHEGENGLIITMSDLDLDMPPLRVSEWDGAPGGPYHFLYFTPVPGNSLPLPPVATWRDLHELSNILFRKLWDQAERQKQVGLVPGASKEDAERITNAYDGQWVQVDQTVAQQIVETSYGGINQNNLAMFLQTNQLFSRSAGNLDLLGGLAPQSGTLGQDELLAQSASVRVRGMQERVKAAAKGVIRAVGYYLWHDELAEVPIEFRIPGSAETAQATWTAERRQGEWYEYAIDIEPYSLQSKTPAEQLSFVNTFFSNVLLPSLPIMQAQGIAPNMEALIKLVAQLANMPQLIELVTFLNGEMMPSAEPMKLPQTSARKYEHINRTAGMTDKGAANVMSQMMMGGTASPQSSEAMVRRSA